MSEPEMMTLRSNGSTIANIAEIAGVTERVVQSVMRKHGLCRDQRPIHEYSVTVMVPEIVIIGAMSKAQAGEAVRAMYTDNVRIDHVERR